MPNQGSRLILPTCRAFVTNFLILLLLFINFFAITWAKSMHADYILS